MLKLLQPIKNATKLSIIGQHRFFHVSRNRLGELVAEQTSKPLPSPKKKYVRKFLLGTTLTASLGYLTYYELALNAKEKRRVRVQINSFFRAFRSFKEVLMIGADYKWTLRGLDEDDEKYDELIKGCHKRAAQRLVEACIANGGMYVKMGQAVSTMNHILPKEFYLTLRKLQTEALRSQGVEIDQLFMEEFDKLPNEIFEEFEYESIAAASLAHVHKARTKDGERVAVKLQYIDLQDRFAGDLFTVKCLLKLVGFAFPSFEFSWILDELREVLTKELDFENEAANSKRCYDELKHLGFVYVPKVLDSLTTKRILTMEYIDGFKISDLEEMKKANIDIKKLDENLIKMFAEQIFHTGFVHADPHHGNIFVRLVDNGKKTQIVLIDHGLYDYVSEKDRRTICKLWKNIILKNDEEMKRYTAELNVDEKHYLILSSFLYMRPLHRSMHPKIILDTTWANMSDMEREKALSEGQIVMPSPKQFRNMKSSELSEWRAKLKPFFEEIKENILIVFRSFPRGLMLVCRNLNTVRSIIHDHGNLIDRHTIMARIAISGSYKDQMKLSLRQRLRAWFELRLFDFILFTDRAKKWIAYTYINIMVKLGKIKPEFLSEISQSMNEVNTL